MRKISALLIMSLDSILSNDLTSMLYLRGESGARARSDSQMDVPEFNDGHTTHPHRSSTMVTRRTRFQKRGSRRTPALRRLTRGARDVGSIIRLLLLLKRLRG